MSLLLPVLVAVPLGLLLGGSLTRLADTRLRMSWLLFLALGLQVVAFPFGFLPWQTGDMVATGLWLASLACLAMAAAANRRLAGAPVVAVGLAANLAAILANGGRMPVLPSARDAAGYSYAEHANSVADAAPGLAWLVDRFAAPSWVPFANVYSVGDVIVAAGAVLLVLQCMGVHLPGLRAQQPESTQRGGVTSSPLRFASFFNRAR